MARSLVRLAEIQATLQEQRILFLRQQMADLERVERPSREPQPRPDPAPALPALPSQEETSRDRENNLPSDSEIGKSIK